MQRRAVKPHARKLRPALLAKESEVMKSPEERRVAPGLDFFVAALPLRESPFFALSGKW
jgi:hypothetical protein